MQLLTTRMTTSNSDSSLLGRRRVSHNENYSRVLNELRVFFQRKEIKAARKVLVVRALTASKPMCFEKKQSVESNKPSNLRFQFVEDLLCKKVKEYAKKKLPVSDQLNRLIQVCQNNRHIKKQFQIKDVLSVLGKEINQLNQLDIEIFKDWVICFQILNCSSNKENPKQKTRELTELFLNSISGVTDKNIEILKLIAQLDNSIIRQMLAYKVGHKDFSGARKDELLIFLLTNEMSVFAPVSEYSFQIRIELVFATTNDQETKKELLDIISKDTNKYVIDALKESMQSKE